MDTQWGSSIIPPHALRPRHEVLYTSSVPMLLLAIETSTPFGSVAITDGDAVVTERAWEGKEGHAAQLMPAIEALLREAGVEGAMVQGIAIAIGPGSFTGLRVGLATAKGLALGWGQPLVAVSSLAALAMHAEGRKETLIPMFDARRGEIYWGAYRSHGTSVLPERVGSAEECAAELRRRRGPCLCLGDGFLKYREIFLPSRQESDGAIVEPSDPHWHRPRAAFVGRLGAQVLARGERAELATLVPNYLRRTAAEIRKGQQGVSPLPLGRG